MPNFKILLLFVSTVLSVVATGQQNATFPTHFNTLTTADGLSYNHITALCQDSYGFIWIGTRYGLNRYDGYRFQHFFYEANDTAGINANQIRQIWEDRSHNIWVATSSNVLNRYNRLTESFEPVDIPGLDHFIRCTSQRPGTDTLYLGIHNDRQLYAVDLQNAAREVVVTEQQQCKDPYPIDNILQDSRGRLWFADWQALHVYDPADQNMQCFKHEASDESSLSNSYVSALYEDRRGQIWVGTANGLNRWNPEAGHFRRILPSHYLPDLDTALYNYITAIEEDAAGNLWLGTGEGLLYFHTTEERFAVYRPPAGGLTGGGVFDLMRDNSGVLWIGTGEGLCRLYPGIHQFDRGVHDILVTSAKEAANTKQILRTGPGTYWMSANFGLFRSRKQGDRFVRELLHPGEFHGLYQSKDGSVFAGALNNGVYQFEDGRLTRHLSRAVGQLSGSYCWAITEDVAGTLWVAAVGNLNRYQPDREQFGHYNDPGYRVNAEIDLSDSYILHTDRRDNLWIGASSGLYFLAKGELQKPFGTPLDFKAYYHDSQQRASLSSSYVTCIYEASDGAIWIGTDNGLNRFADGQFIRYQDQLPGQKVMSMLEDDSGNLWLGTTNGLARFDPTGQKFTNYSTADGLPSNSFQLGNCLREEDGTLVFGTEKGFVSFQPARLVRNTQPPAVYITDFRLFNQSVKVGAQDSLLTSAIQYAENLELRYDQNVLTFEFAALNYFNPELNSYAYQLIGFDDSLQYIGHRREATFTNLDAGEYTLWVKAANNHGVWNEEGVRLPIHILPPWYRTWWAYLLWISLLLGGAYRWYHFQLSRQLNRAETERLKDLDAVKTNLYTNITHEFRTPLTVILGMARNIQRAPDEWSAKGAIMIERNGQNLLDLVNQMLDLSKLEAGSLGVNKVQADLINYLQSLVEPFQAWAKDKDIALHLLNGQASLLMDFDPEKIQAIVSNLLANAIQFTPSGGAIYFRVQVSGEHCVQLTVEDTGRGMTALEMDRIFDRFYQAESGATGQGQGTGIGLALTKGLVELLAGHIEVESTVGKGSSFRVTLPITRSRPKGEIPMHSGRKKMETLVAPSTLSSDGDPNLPLLLIVEDSDDVVLYLQSCLQADYRLAVAKNGQEGVDKTMDLQPAVVISDVMMPAKNGFELCAILKQSPSTSHIPIILLTAKADIDSKLEGLTTGADAYLSKPFQKEELLIRVQKLIELRRQLRTYYTSADFFNLAIPSGENRDEWFLHQFKAYVEEHLDSPDLDVEALCKKLGLSRTAFYHKVNALVGMPPATYIRLVRLNYAKKLLGQTDLTVTQIAYRCGFSSQSLFSRSFTANEGMSPSRFRAKRS